jgi:8-oxo-dGTP diphosphatase
MAGSLIFIAVGVVTNPFGQVLIARRPPDVHQGGLWEFPGGKLEPGEDVLQALRRELKEELGIEPGSARPLIRVHHAYPDKEVLLNVWRIDQWCGEAYGREGQPIAWVAPEALDNYQFPNADRPIITAIRLPPLYLISPEPPADISDFLKMLESCLEAGCRLFQLRAKRYPRTALAPLAHEVSRLCNYYGATFLLNGSPEEALALNAHGVHLTSEWLQRLQERPLKKPYWVAVSCHNRADIEQASRIDADLAVISPVQKTPSHPETSPLGWEEFKRLAERAFFPVYALGGMRPSHLSMAWAHGGQGIAMVSGVWDADDPASIVRVNRMSC